MLFPASVELSVTSPDTWRTVVKGQTLWAPQNWYSLLLVFGGEALHTAGRVHPFQEEEEMEVTQGTGPDLEQIKICSVMSG